MNELIDALINLIEAKKDYDSLCRRCCEDWSYFGSHQIERLEKAEKRFVEALNSVIDERIKEKANQ